MVDKKLFILNIPPEKVDNLVEKCKEEIQRLEQ